MKIVNSQIRDSPFREPETRYNFDAFDRVEKPDFCTLSVRYDRGGETRFLRHEYLKDFGMPILDPNVVEFVSGSPAQTARLGERLGRLLRGGEVICLAGNLGAGKTCFAQGIGRGWGAADNLTSPTFTLIHELRRASDKVRLYHVDLYRIEKEAEAWLLGLSDLMDATASVLIEWPERAPSLLPPDRLWIDLEFLDDTRRRLSFTATDDVHLELLSAFKKSAFGI
jgi:tRNA threonylcarbamoyladenosine biosynthesis protein TsaE